MLTYICYKSVIIQLLILICYFTSVTLNLLLYICYHRSFNVLNLNLYLRPFESVLIDRFYLAPVHI